MDPVAVRYWPSWTPSSVLDDLRAAVPKPDAHDDELRRADRRDADLDHQAAFGDLGRGIQAFVDPDLIGLVPRLPCESTVLPHTLKKVADRPFQALPERTIVGLEDGPPDSLLDRLLDVEHQA